MKKYRYPYIPKEYYPAVMYACKLVRETGYKNKAIEKAANYYGVDEDEVRKHFEARNAAGCKAKSAAKGRKYKYFVVGVFFGSDAHGETGYPAKVVVCKGLTKDTVSSRFAESDYRFDMAHWNSAAYRYHKVLSEHDTAEEAQKAARAVETE
jgi:hypothetical protein